MQVFALPAGIGSTGPDPWADIETTHADSAIADARPAKPRPPAGRAALLWAFVGLAVLVGVGLVASKLFKAAEPKGALAVETDEPGWEVVVKRGGQVVRDRTRDREFVLPPGEYSVEAADPITGLKIKPDRVSLANGGNERIRLWVDKPKPPRPKDPSPTPAASPERKAAEALRPYCESITLQLTSGQEVTARKGEPLPASDFVVTKIYIGFAYPVPTEVVEPVFLPALTELRSLTYLYAWNTLHLNEDQLRQFLRMPLNKALTGLVLPFQLTPQTLGDLKQLPKLTGLQCFGDVVDDALLEELQKNIPNLAELFLVGVGNTKEVTARGLEAIAKLPLRSLSLVGSRAVDAPFIRLLADIPTLRQVSFDACPLGDDSIMEVARCTGLDTVIVSGTRLTDTGLERLKDMPGVRLLDFRGTRVSPAAVAKLAETFPLCRILWDGKPFEPKPLLDVTRARVAVLLDGGVMVTVPDRGEQRRLKSAEDLKAGERLWNIYIGTAADRNPLERPSVLGALRSLPPECWDPGRGTLSLEGPLTADQFAAIVRAPGVRPIACLRLFFVGVPEAALSHLSELPRLRTLIIHRAPKITQVGLKQITALPKLENVYLEAVGLAPDSLGALRGFAGARLMLTGNAGVDDNAAVPLAAIPTLQHLDLKGTGVTKAGVDKLVSLSPTCQIIWDGGTIDPLPQYELERTAAQALLPHCDFLVLKLASGASVKINAGEVLPTEKFVVTRIWFKSGKLNDEAAVDSALFSAFRQLHSLEVLYGWRSLPLTADQLDLLSRLPLAGTVTNIRAEFDLTPGVIDALKRFPKLTVLQCYASKPDDALFEHLARAVPTLVELHLVGGNETNKVSARGYEAVAKMPLRDLSWYGLSVNRTFLKLLAVNPKLRGLNFEHGSISDDDLKELRSCAHLSGIGLSETNVTDAGLEALGEIASLRWVDIRKTKVTEAKVRKLAEVLPTSHTESD